MPFAKLADVFLAVMVMTMVETDAYVVAAPLLRRIVLTTEPPVGREIGARFCPLISAAQIGRRGHRPQEDRVGRRPSGSVSGYGVRLRGEIDCESL